MENMDQLKSLIMVGAAKAVKCGPCLEHAFNFALEAGCDAEQIGVALEMGDKVKNGSHTMLSAQVDEQLNELLDDMGIVIPQPKAQQQPRKAAPCACS